MRLFSYIVSHDTGFAPNPFWGFCTLGCCKPVIRRVAQKGDWIAGISPKSLGHNLVYAMQITEDPLSFADYFQADRFECKKPDYRKRDTIKLRGDNIYMPSGKGEYKHLRSRHSLATGAGDVVKKRRDLSGRYVLISYQFYYWGRDAIALPAHLKILIASRGHKSRFDSTIMRKFLSLLDGFDTGLLGTPSDWPTDDSRASLGSS